MIPKAHLSHLPLDSMKVGEQQKFNHDECPAGVDTRHRLYVLRKEHNLWLAYCHNCSQGNAFAVGVKPTETSEVMNRLLKFYEGETVLPEEMTLTRRDIQLPDDYTTSYHAFPAWVHDRLWSCHTTLDPLVIKPYHWGYSPSRDQLIIPIFTPPGSSEVVGFQARLKPGEKPKCITTYHPDHKGEPILYEDDISTVLVLVEDPLSAARIHGELGYSTVALLGTHLNDVALTEILRRTTWKPTNTIVIWMDDDTPGKEASFKIYHRLRGPVNASVSIFVATHPEAKSIKDLKGVVLI